MFLENDYARPLFDFVKGGKPSGYLCLMCKDKQKVTRTERGMRMHLKLVHKWEEQPSLYSTVTRNPERPSVNDLLRRVNELLFRSLNVRKKVRPIKKEDQKPKVTPETKEPELLKLMKGGN